MRRSILSRKVILNLTTVLTAFLLAAFPGNAATVLITNESGITADGIINWGDLGNNSALVASPFNLPVHGVSGLTVMGSIVGSGYFTRFDQSPLPGWPGNFGAGEKLLYMGTLSDQGEATTSLHFSSSVAGVGVQIEAAISGGFTANIQAFDAADVLLGSYSLLGDSTYMGGDTAIFIGILSDSTNIDSVVFGATSVSDTSPAHHDFVINGPIVQTSVPEPTTMLLLGLGLVGLAGIGRKLQK